MADAGYQRYRAGCLEAENEILRAALNRVRAALSRRSQPVMDPDYTAAFNAALDMVAAALSEQEGKPAKDVGREGAFRAGYKAGFDAAKHPFHMPVADEAFAFFSEQEGK